MSTLTQAMLLHVYYQSWTARYKARLSIHVWGHFTDDGGIIVGTVNSL